MKLRTRRAFHDEDAMLDYTSDPELIHETFSAQVDLVVDGGSGGLDPSTILDCTGGNIKLIREGKGVADFMAR